jgi:hypothetical protein
VWPSAAYRRSRPYPLACAQFAERQRLPCDSGDMTGPLQTPSPARALSKFVYGDAPLDEWAAQGAGDPGEPWNSFEQARQLVRAGQQHEAVKIWLQIASTEGLESRQILQAWHFLRHASCPPPADQAKLVLGVAAEMPVQGAHDLLAAYRDGSARYLNYSDKVVVWEDRSVADIQTVIDGWLARGQGIANVIGPWDEQSLPPLPAGNARVMVLTPSGPHFGQGPLAALSADPMAGSFLTAATSLMQLIVSRAMT